MHIFDIVARLAKDDGDRVALQYADASSSWLELSARVYRAAGALTAAGIGKGDRVAFLDKNNAACIETTLACSLVGAANAVVNFRLAPEEIAFIVNDSGAKVLFVGGELLSTVAKIRAELSSVTRIVVVSGSTGGDDDYESWLSRAEPLAPKDVVSAAPDDCFLQLYTSGTTGFPKGAMLTHRSLLAHCEAAAHAFCFSRASINMVAMPLFHVGGTSWALTSMWVGGKTVIVRDVVPPDVLAAIARERITHAFFVPAVFGFFLALPDVAAHDYSSLTCLGYGGSPMPLPLLEQCLKVFPVDFYQVYGMTEASGVFAVLGPNDHRDEARKERRTSAGNAVKGVRIKVTDPITGEDVEPGTIGELRIFSDQKMSGYFQNSEATSHAIEDGWLRTGDVGKIDADGFVFIHDRVKDMVISGGENVYPAEVERVLSSHPEIREVAVIGVPDERWGEAVKAIIVANGETLKEAEILAYCRARLAGYKCPKSVDFVSALPRNATGKVLKRTLREPYWAGRTRAI